MSIPRATRTPARGRHTTGKETALFVLAATVIAIHVIDDSFLQSQPGTSAGDHVFSGLIPLPCSPSRAGPSRGFAPARGERSP
ncbi:MAG TPA: hypothetical protein VFY45_15000 [Baekduia sp.]|nr:hypothetical protein [Baekduia sp.]